MIDQVAHLLDVEVDLEPWSGQDEYGRPSTGAKRTVKARVYQGMFDVMGANGMAIVARYKVILGEPVQVDPRDVLTLPASFGVRDSAGTFQKPTPLIREVRPVFYRGVHDHTVVICG
jgi:hypothetical protein